MPNASLGWLATLRVSSFPAAILAEIPSESVAYVAAVHRLILAMKRAHSGETSYADTAGEGPRPHLNPMQIAGESEENITSAGSGQEKQGGTIGKVLPVGQC